MKVTSLGLDAESFFGSCCWVNDHPKGSNGSKTNSHQSKSHCQHSNPPIVLMGVELESKRTAQGLFGFSLLEIKGSSLCVFLRVLTDPLKPTRGSA